MTNYNERLDEILERVLSQETSREGGYAEYYADDTEYRESLPYGNHLANQGELKQAIIDWHNKQVEEAIEATEKITADIEFKAGINYATMSGDYVHRDEVAKRIEEVIKKPHILPQNAQHIESLKQGINFYHRQMRKRVDKLKEKEWKRL